MMSKVAYDKLGEIAPWVLMISSVIGIGGLLYRIF